MKKIKVETTIKKWSNMKGCEDIEFTKLDCTSNQVADIDSIITNSQKGDTVTLTIESAHKKLQIPPIVSPIKLTGIDCRKGGKKLIVTGFKTPKGRAEVMRSLTDIGDPIFITITDAQEKIPVDKQKTFDESERPGLDDNQPDTKSISAKEYIVNESGVITNPEVITVKLPKKYGTMVAMTLGRSNDNWYFGYDLTIGHEGLGSPCSSDGGENILTAIAAAKDEIFNWIDLHKDYKYARQAKKKIEKAIDDWLFENNK